MLCPQSRPSPPNCLLRLLRTARYCGCCPQSHQDPTGVYGTHGERGAAVGTKYTAIKFVISSYDKDHSLPKLTKKCVVECIYLQNITKVSIEIEMSHKHATTSA